jgi:hypothetical protein
MSNEIDVGEYVRTKDGKIGIFDRYSLRKENSLYKSPFNCFIKIRNRKTPLQCCEDYIVKHSKQLIDLIEVGDIVRIRTGLYSSFMEFIDNEECLLILKEQVKKFGAIEEILTREEFEANCYKVGGKNE